MCSVLSALVAGFRFCLALRLAFDLLETLATSASSCLPSKHSVAGQCRVLKGHVAHIAQCHCTDLVIVQPLRRLRLPARWPQRLVSGSTFHTLSTCGEPDCLTRLITCLHHMPYMQRPTFDALQDAALIAAGRNTSAWVEQLDEQLCSKIIYLLHLKVGWGSSLLGIWQPRLFLDFDRVEINDGRIQTWSKSSTVEIDHG